MNTLKSKTTRIETEYHENKLPARLLPVSEVARFLGVHSSTVRRWERTGILKSYAIGFGRNLRFKQEDVLNFLDECQKENGHGVLLNGRLDKRRYKSNRR